MAYSQSKVDLHSLALGSHTFTVEAVDYNGNSSSQSVTFTIISSVASLQTSVQRLYNEGKITKANVYMSLMDQLRAAAKTNSLKTRANILQAFISLVQAQKGKSITPAAADLLIADARWVIANRSNSRTISGSLFIRPLENTWADHSFAQVFSLYKALFRGSFKALISKVVLY